MASRCTATSRACGAAGRDERDVVGGHRDRVALEEARAAGVEHDDVRAVARRARSASSSHQTVSPATQPAGRPRRRARSPETGASRSASSPVPCRPPVRVTAAAGRARRVVLDRHEPVEARGPRSRSTSGGWQTSGTSRGSSADRGLVEVVGVQVRDDDGVEAPPRPPPPAPAARPSGSAAALGVPGNRRPRAGGSSMGSTSSRRPGELDEEGRVADRG